jgi:hypothetical protein
LKVGGKAVATGELVIINDRFGVRIKEINDSSSAAYDASISENHSEESEQNNDEENFDYSDFEVEDENSAQ